MSAHSYILKEGKWHAQGTLYDPYGKATPIQGHSVTRHKEDVWLNESEMSMQSEKPISFSTLYEIEPMSANMESTIWETDHASLGLLVGTLVIIEDALVMSYSAEGGHYSGTEILRQIDENHYQSWGVLWQGDQKISSWQANLERVETHGA